MGKDNLLHEILNFVSHLSIIIQLLFFIVIILILVIIFLYLYIKVLKPTIDTNKLDTVSQENKKLWDKIELLEATQKNLLYSKSLSIDITNINHIDKLFFSQEIRNAAGDMESETDNFIKGLMKIVEFESTQDQGKLRKAIDFFNNAINIAENKQIDGKYKAEYYNYIGVAHDKLNEYQEALEFYDLSIKSAQYEKPFYNRACTLAVLYNFVVNSKEEFFGNIIYNRKQYHFDSSELVKVFCFEKTIESIKKALELDASNYKLIMSDPDLKEVSKTKEFTDLVKQFGKIHNMCSEYEPLQ